MTITYIKAAAATLNNNSKTITVTGEHVDFSKANDYLVALDNGLYVLPVASGTAPDANGDSTLTLAESWQGVTLSNKGLFIFPTFAKIYESVAAMTGLNEITRGILTKLKDLLTATTPTIDITVGQTSSIEAAPYGYLSAQVTGLISQLNSLVGSVTAMTKAEFFALTEQRKSQSAGSGFSEWGKHAGAPVNQGLWTYASVSAYSNNMRLGRTDTGISGTSNTEMARVIVNGVFINLTDANSSNDSTIIRFPNAPDGTETYDTSNGNVVQHTSAELAFASETATNKVITSRQDFVFLESFHEKISDKDIVYPLGNVQYGARSYEGITLGTNGIAQGYSAFGGWDTTTTGNGAIWSTLSDANKEEFIQDPDNNIYSDGGELIQVRYRVRVVKGLGDIWASVQNFKAGYVGYDGINRLAIQGNAVESVDFVTNTSEHYYGSGNNEQGQGEGIFIDYGNNSNRGHDSIIGMIPIALVSRRNSGAYHPVYNSEGTAWNHVVGDTNTRRKWHELDTGASPISSTAMAFEKVCSNANGKGNIASSSSGASGRSDSKFYDAIYASDVSDLRMSSKKLPLSEIREKYKRMAIAGEVRGFESVPFTYRPEESTTLANSFLEAGITVFKTAAKPVHLILPVAELRGYIVFGSITFSGVWYAANEEGRFRCDASYGDVTASIPTGSVVWAITQTQQTHKQANPTWTDIIGDPSNIAATFPDGVEGQWIPVIPDGTSYAHPLNRKSLVSNTDRIKTDDNGGTWSADTRTVATTSNTMTASSLNSTVQLLHYETQAHFTSDSDSSKVLDLGCVYANSDGSVAEILCSGLIGKIPTETWSSNGNHVTSDNTSISSYFILKGDDTLYSDGLYGGAPEHGTLFNTNQSGGNSPALKTLDYLSHDNNVAKLCYAYKEMIWDNGADSNDIVEIYDGSSVSVVVGGLYGIRDDRSAWFGLVVKRMSTDSTIDFNNLLYGLDRNGDTTYNGVSDPNAWQRWDGNGFGDNNKFEITNNQSTLTDDNGNSVLYGSASFDTQYFIVET